MDVKTKWGTTVQVEKEKLLEFPEGLFGFEGCKNYAIFESDYPPFMWMQSLEEERLAFLIVDPFVVAPDYELDIDDKSLSKIDVTSPAQVHVMVIVTIPSDGSPITVNLQGPLVINHTNQKCMQVVLNDGRWNTKFDVLKALKANEAKSSKNGGN